MLRRPPHPEQFERSATAFLAPAERQALHAGAMAAPRDTVLRKLSRVLVLELNAARITGSLTAADSAGRWTEFVDRTREPGCWDSLATNYPPLLPRLRRPGGCRYEEFRTDAARRGRPPAARPAPEDPATVELRGVGFRYQGADRDALTGIDLTIHSGQMVAWSTRTGPARRAWRR